MTTKQRISATVDADLLAAAQQAAAESRASNLSAWLSDAIRQKLEDHKRRQALAEFIAQAEAEHGIITDEEIAQVTRDMAARAIRVRGRKRAKRARPKRRAA
jgi:metal-responsive CopG/Arc/MetJ family transcriptional regulator